MKNPTHNEQEIVERLDNLEEKFDIIIGKLKVIDSFMETMNKLMESLFLTNKRISEVITWVKKLHGYPTR